MPQTQAQQQLQQQQQSNKKKKYATRKTVPADEKQTSESVGVGVCAGAGVCDGDGAGDGGAVKSCSLPEKKPLHASMEQLKVCVALHGQQAERPKTPASKGEHADGSWRKTSTDSTESTAEANEENKMPAEGMNAASERTLSKSARMRQRRKAAHRNKYVAMDCEMVGVGYNGQGDMLARVSIVNKQGEVLLDKFVKPRQTVTDYRTSVSGVRPRDIEHGEEFNFVQDEVVELLQGKILVGHAIRNDLAVLQIKHPFVNIRDTSRYKPLCRLVANGRTPSLKRLTQAILGLEIQTGEHNSVEDARAAMNIYNRLSGDWEQYIQKKLQHSHQHHNHYHHQQHHKHEDK